MRRQLSSYCLLFAIASCHLSLPTEDCQERPGQPASRLRRRPSRDRSAIHDARWVEYAREDGRGLIVCYMASRLTQGCANCDKLAQKQQHVRISCTEACDRATEDSNRLVVFLETRRPGVMTRDQSLPDKPMTYWVFVTRLSQESSALDELTDSDCDWKCDHCLPGTSGCPRIVHRCIRSHCLILMSNLGSLDSRLFDS